MFPNPHDALPLPARPKLEYYKKLAKDLAKAARDPDGTGAVLPWARRWVESLAKHSAGALPHDPRSLAELAQRIAEFARRTLESKGGSDRPGAAKGALTGAQFVLARCHGFESWLKFSTHLDRLAHGGSSDAVFEAAADAVVGGDMPALKALLAANPALMRARSSREHRATLLHYVAANGVENYRQKVPANAVEILETLLRAGAEVDAAADLYGGGATTLGLVATSGHPQAAGVQIALMEKLQEHGASLTPELRLGREGKLPLELAGVCLANGRLEAAEFLAERGAPVSLAAAAGLGMLDRVRESCDAGGTAIAGDSQLEQGFLWACQYGRVEVAEFLLDRGMAIATCDRNGQTGLHWAVIGGRIAMARMLLRYNAPLEARNVYGGTVLGQALWSAQQGGASAVYVEIVDLLLAAGAIAAEGDAGQIDAAG